VDFAEIKKGGDLAEGKWRGEGRKQFKGGYTPAPGKDRRNQETERKKANQRRKKKTGCIRGKIQPKMRGGKRVPRKQYREKQSELKRKRTRRGLKWKGEGNVTLIHPMKPKKKESPMPPNWKKGRRESGRIGSTEGGEKKKVEITAWTD